MGWMLVGCRARALADVPRAPSTDAPVAALEPWVEAAPGVSWRGAEVPWDDAPTGLFGVSEPNPTLAWVVVRLDLSRVRLTAERASRDTFRELTLDSAILAAVDAGFFERDRSPTGLLVSEGRLLHGWAHAGGSGVLELSSGVARVVPSAGYARGASLAVQCGPRLVEPGRVVGIRRDDGERFARTAACVRDQGRTLDLVATWGLTSPLRGPGLLRFAQRLAGPSPVGDPEGCEAALNLDGGPSTAVYVRGPRGTLHGPQGPTPWVLVVR